MNSRLLHKLRLECFKIMEVKLDRSNLHNTVNYMIFLNLCFTRKIGYLLTNQSPHMKLIELIQVTIILIYNNI